MRRGADEAAVGAMNRPLRAVVYGMCWGTHYPRGTRRGRFIGPRPGLAYNRSEGCGFWKREGLRSRIFYGTVRVGTLFFPEKSAPSSLTYQSRVFPEGCA